MHRARRLRNRIYSRLVIEDAAVTEVQTMLKTLGYQLAVDGVFGANTKEAVVSFEMETGLPGDGAIDAHRASCSDVGEPRDRLLRVHGVHPHERGHDAEDEEHEDAPEDAGETSPMQGAVSLLLDV
jgi:peptidoglycan hydrolase-like protein with peptidoglycan-binding domain